MQELLKKVPKCNGLYKGTHSCKATLLSWLAKSGAREEARKLFGGHVLAKDLAMTSYSRDSLSGPLRVVADLLHSVRSGEFDPDADRSGRWKVRRSGEGSEPAALPADKPLSSDGESSDSSDSTSDP